MSGTANRSSLSIIEEEDFAVIPSSGNPKALRFTGESLDFTLNTSKSAEIRADRQVSDLVTTGAAASGGINIEWSFAEYNQLLQAALQGTWNLFGTNGVGAVIPTSATFAANSLTAGANTTGTSLFTNLQKGQWITVTGSTNPAQNKRVQVSRTVAPTATVLTFEGSPFTGATGLGGANVKISAGRLTNGTVQRNFTIERAHEDINQYFAFRGLTVDKFSLNIASGAIVTGSFEFMGRDSVRDDATQLPGTVTPSQTFDIANAVKGVGNFSENNVLLSDTFIKSMKLDIGNALRARDAVSVLGAASIGSGEISVGGTLEVYFANGDMYDKFINSISTSLEWTLTDGAGNGYAFHIPKLKFSNAKINSGGKDQDIMFSTSFTGLMDPVSGRTILVDRFSV